jgi:hypothetical protein
MKLWRELHKIVSNIKYLYHIVVVNKEEYLLQVSGTLASIWNQAKLQISSKSVFYQAYKELAINWLGGRQENRVILSLVDFFPQQV